MRRKYLEYLQSIRNLSPNTLSSYEKDLSVYVSFLAERGYDEKTIDTRQVREFVSFLSKKSLSPKSINRVLSCIRGYYRFQERYGYLEANPFSGIRSLKSDKWLPEFLFEEETEELLGLANEGIMEGLRDRLIFEFLYSTGARVTEAVTLDVTDINLCDGTVKVCGKGRKERMVFLGEKAVGACRKYFPARTAFLREHPHEGRAETALFVNKNGERLTARGVRVIFAKYIRKMRVAKHVTPHTMRHTFATHILNRGADIRVVQELLGHASLSTTQVYTHVGVERLKNIYKTAHPHAHRGEKGTGQ